MLPDYRVRQRDYLLEISRALTSRLNLNEVLRLILQQAAEMLNGHAALIALVEPDARYAIRQSYGIPQPLLDQLQPILNKLEDVDEAISALERHLIAIARAVGLGLWQVVSLPLKIEGEEFLGAIYVFRMRGGGFSRDDRRVLQSFADQAAIAVHNARLYEQLNQEKSRLNAILEFSADGVVIMDAAHRIQIFNRAMSNLLGIPASEAIGRKFEDVIVLRQKRAGTTLEEAEAQGWPLVGASAVLFVEGDLLRRNGSLVSVEISFAPLFNRERKLVNIIADVHDLTRIRAAEEMKATFISAVSHELKTPVALIKGYASTLRRADAQWDESTVRESLKVIEEEADHLAELIENLLDASRAQAGSFKLAPVELDIDDLVVRVAKKFQDQTPHHRIVADVPPDMPLVFADEARITQVLSNLISNAVKYSPPNSEIRISGRTTPKEVIITVADQGIGITPEERDRLFERFYRSERAVRRGTPGTGLGLYLSKAIVEAHGGRIWVEDNKAGQTGARFSFSLPRAT
jgi:PAS domain S-box-containing protein